MNRKVKRNLLIFVLVGGAMAAAFGYYLFNKGPKDVKGSSAIEVSATSLYEEFNSDSSKALQKYSGQVLLVDGEVSGVSVNQQKQKVVLLHTNTGGASVNCTLEEDPGEIGLHTKVKIKGICSGPGQADEELGIKADLYLTRCYLIK